MKATNRINGMAAPIVDAHAHIFERTLPLADDRRYTPDRDARISDYLTELDQNGFTHGVLVQPSFLGLNNSYLLDALRAYPDRLRGVVVVDPTIDESELTDMAASGVVGVRLNLWGRVIPDFREASWLAFQAKLQRLGLHVQVHCPAVHLGEVLPGFLRANNRVVVDHFGRPDAALGTDDPGFRYLLAEAAAAAGQVWVKLSAAYRLGNDSDAANCGPDFAARLTGALGLERLVWGSDWPHTDFSNRMDFKSARGLLDSLIPDSQSRRQILGVSAKELYRI
jgi:predicted TIM-barrel fold metal-dependent hydrolase